MSKADPATRRSIADLVDKVAKMPTPSGERPIDGDTYRAGALVRKMRRMRALTQKQLAERLGVSQARVSEIETGIGVQGLTWALMERIARACEMGIFVQPDDDSHLIDAYTLEQHGKVIADEDERGIAYG